MRLILPVGLLLVAVTVGAVAVAVWVSVADAPWENDQGSTNLLCQDALQRRQAVQDALQRPITIDLGSRGSSQKPLSTFRGVSGPLGDEVVRLESSLLGIQRDIQSFCQ